MEAVTHACWISFAKTGQPSCGGQAWPAYSPTTDSLMEFGPTFGIETGFRKAQYDALQRAMLPRLVSVK